MPRGRGGPAPHLLPCLAAVLGLALVLPSVGPADEPGGLGAADVPLTIHREPQPEATEALRRLLDPATLEPPPARDVLPDALRFFEGQQISELVPLPGIREIVVPPAARHVSDEAIRRALTQGRVAAYERLTPLHLRPCAAIRVTTSDGRIFSLCLFDAPDGRGQLTLPDGTRLWFVSAPPGSRAMDRPLTAELFVRGRFVAYTDLWAVTVPGGDPIVFRADGTVQSQRAGLGGRWTIVAGTALVIGDRWFTYSPDQESLFSPLVPGGSVGFHIVPDEEKERWWARRRTRP